MARRKFSENKIWQNWREFNLAYGRKHLFWRELNLVNKHKIAYNKCFFIQKLYIYLANNQDKTKENHNNDVFEINRNNQKVTRHKKIKIRVIRVRKKKKKKKKEANI